ncbi:hypothetical protein Mal64_03940 [Pseudobythopirellula maris]|uniref:Uncharacterized protein n=1 Tax=Pseudobythopirellula maris TaxID=2527991 RepID=A0A5C5ZR37_9BACT|nr:hypothetical protein [Pseudobythopirellula maris]TWT90012.1 hypothetical protein Mal64_03940 [Pseudobythopirellula maris]
MTATEAIAGRIKHLRRVLKKQPEALASSFESSVDRIRKHGESENPRSAVLLGSSCEYLASDYGFRGMMTLIDGDQSGWESIDKALQLFLWRAKFDLASRVKAIERDDFYSSIYLGFEMADCASALCHAYYSSQHGWHQELSEAWRRFVEIPDLHELGSDFWRGGVHGEAHYEAYCVRLFREGVARPAWELPDYIEGRDLGPFQKIVDEWRTPDRLGDAFVIALDYHCANFEDDGPGTPWAPFKHLPFDLVPVWYLASLKRRREEGLETPEVDHPLLRLPTAQPGGYVFGTAKDPLFEELEGYYKKYDLSLDPPKRAAGD